MLRMMKKVPQFVFNLLAGLAALVVIFFILATVAGVVRDVVEGDMPLWGYIYFSLLAFFMIFRSTIRDLVLYFGGTKETHRLLSEILAELKKGDAEKDANKKD